MPHVLTFHPSGRVQGIYTEAIDLSSLGELYIERISAIEFDNSLQHWCVRALDGRCLFSDPSREECLRWEQEYFGQPDK